MRQNLRGRRNTNFSCRRRKKLEGKNFRTNSQRKDKQLMYFSPVTKPGIEFKFLGYEKLTRTGGLSGSDSALR